MTNEKKMSPRKTHTQNSHCSQHDPSIPMFFMGQNLVKIQFEKYDLKLLYKEKIFMEKVTQICQNLKFFSKSSIFYDKFQ